MPRWLRKFAVVLTLTLPIPGTGSVGNTQENGETPPDLREQTNAESDTDRKSKNCIEQVAEGMKYLPALQGMCDSTDSDITLDNTTAAFPNLDEISADKPTLELQMDSESVRQ